MRRARNARVWDAIRKRDEVAARSLSSIGAEGAALTMLAAGLPQHGDRCCGARAHVLTGGGVDGALNVAVALVHLNNLSALSSVCSTPHNRGRPTSAQASISFTL
jgi:hypothetical protein